VKFVVKRCQRSTTKQPCCTRKLRLISSARYIPYVPDLPFLRNMHADGNLTFYLTIYKIRLRLIDIWIQIFTKNGKISVFDLQHFRGGATPMLPLNWWASCSKLSRNRQNSGKKLDGLQLSGTIATRAARRAYIAQYGQGRGLPKCQVPSSSIQPFGHDRHGPKIWGCAPFLGRGAGFPSSTMWPAQRPTYMPCAILIHQAIWP